MRAGTDGTDVSESLTSDLVGLHIQQMDVIWPSRIAGAQVPCDTIRHAVVDLTTQVYITCLGF